MDVRDTPTEATFRKEVNAWLAAHAPVKGSASDWSKDFWNPHADWDQLIDRSRAWQRTLAEHGWAGVSFPTEFGGRGGSAMEELIFNQEVLGFGVSQGAFAVSHTMVVPAILEYGTPEQQHRFLPPTLRGNEIWCQLFSEPGSGSDLASLATRAVLDGDEYVVTGQKVWTSNADHSDWGILLARTDPDATRHRGITYFLLDMQSPGIDIRPLRQMTGQSHFSEIFLTDVRIPATNVLGGPARLGEGWRAAMHTLSNERAMIAAASSADDLEGLTAIARERGLLHDAVVRDGIARAHVGAGILRFLGYRLQTAISHGRPPGPETSVLKLFYSDHLKSITALALRIEGPAGMLTGADPPIGSWTSWFNLRFLYAPSLSIAGGTSEVQRGIIGDRVLGLPPEPRAAPVRSPAGFTQAGTFSGDVHG